MYSMYIHAWHVHACEHLSGCPLPAGAERPPAALPLVSGSQSMQEGEGGRLGQTRVQLQPPIHPPTTTLMASLRPVMNEVSE